ncbi:hypothetical protein PUNSTDRAFT_118198 [Punctularia strigosozonata HHB-11173 SS5]|uniref:uncharacterized protein n=1 Tax=Punctularia strigosozonata (strain HHB-11173) TaxID=741275 RepID=UPI00044181F9|nr:uncharacterized protein PUNSTDRAFT_118198 [Punctularia strigosozonata HHB-11173 SS5]EIN12297.1 hypothetical protein PUNSTDRAFT_118198 [Punctularia strigosozonata HHB-11173 SS5]
MALTATAQSALPSWDESIVPSLRKRLENESRILSKRISNTSMSDEDAYNLRTAHRPTTAASAATANTYRSAQDESYTSATSSRSPRAPGAAVGTASTPSRAKRSRTYSQPWSPDAGSGSRSNSPMVDRNADYIKPSRIPVARARTNSVTSHNATNAAGSPGSYPHANGYSANKDDLWAVQETHADAKPSPQMISVPLRHQNSRIINEQAPFPADSVGSSFRSKYDYNTSYTPSPQAYDEDGTPLGRMSNESEERPFEHWYRGDTSRNGGVGELRVGKRKEMLEIAQHGHSLRSKQFGPSGPGSRATSRADVRSVVGSRRRADSLGARESFYLDEQAEEDLARVLDERPLTDAERDTEGEGEQDVEMDLPSEDDTTRIGKEQLRAETPRAGARSVTPTNHRPKVGRTTTAPAAQSSRARSEPPFASTSKASPSSSRSPNAPAPQQRSRSQQRLLQTPPTTPASKRRVSPASAKSSPNASGKKPKTVAQRRVPQSSLNEDNRRSIGSYPDVEDSLDGETSLADAIPKWTQPKVANGNWDDVVLPAVAKKKGLEEQYEEADGSPKVVQKRASYEYEPAPGTFGYDYSKYRPPRTDGLSGNMDEFGQMPRLDDQTHPDIDPPPTGEEPPAGKQRLRPDPLHLDQQTPIRFNGTPSPRTASPAPFSHYSRDGHGTPIPGAGIQPQQQMDEKRRQPAQLQLEEPEHGGGCCKCVVM